MELITWNKSFETGHPIVDGQHKNLFTMINNLHTSIEAGHPNLVLIETMEKLSAYVETHFNTEEELMLHNSYENYEEHKHEHENLKEQALKLIKLFGMQKVDLTATISQFLSSWLTHHISEVDIKMIKWLKEKNAVDV
jgi:hemerythrin